MLKLYIIRFSFKCFYISEFLTDFSLIHIAIKIICHRILDYFDCYSYRIVEFDAHNHNELIEISFFTQIIGTIISHMISDRSNGCVAKVNCPIL